MSTLTTAGIYKAKAINGEGAICRSNSGTDYVAVLFEITEGPEKGNTIVASLFQTEKTAERTKKALAALGWKGESRDDGEGNCNLVGLNNVVPIGVKEEDYQGRKQIKVDWVFENPMAGINPKDRLTMRDARSVLASLKGGTSNASPRSSSREASPEDDGRDPNW